MTHSVQLIIGRGEAIARFLQRWPGSRAVDLTGGWQAIPLEDGLYELIAAAYAGLAKPDALDMAPPGLMEALAEASSPGAMLAYVETEYFGGTGSQSAVAFVDGRQVFAPARSKGAGGPINGALRAIGVQRMGSDDEFDTIGLGARRTMEDYALEGPRRQRGVAEAPARDKARGAPLWVVLMIIVLAIAMGVGAVIG
ncbi:MAG TPA: hypothetical protein VGO52_03455 [Hyphomonadaceae bacterium]|nr:hypothetical protein [Hyphomonadaceae bacterium]